MVREIRTTTFTYKSIQYMSNITSNSSSFENTLADMYANNVNEEASIIDEKVSEKDNKNSSDIFGTNDIFTMISNTIEKLSCGKIDDNDWRKMTEKSWNAILKGVDNYFDSIRDQMKLLKDMQNKAMNETLAFVSSDYRASMASKAALLVAANGITTVLNESNKSLTMTKTQELMIMGKVETGISSCDNIKESVTLIKDSDIVEEKVWIITAYTETGIICKQCQLGSCKSEILWELTYKNIGDYKKVWNFLDSLSKDTDLTFTTHKEFWEDFLS